jgi:hypothetical protein
VATRIRLIEKINDLIVNRTRELPASSIVPQPTTLLRAPKEEYCSYMNLCNSSNSLVLELEVSRRSIAGVHVAR